MFFRGVPITDVRETSQKVVDHVGLTLTLENSPYIQALFDVEEIKFFYSDYIPAYATPEQAKKPATEMEQAASENMAWRKIIEISRNPNSRLKSSCSDYYQSWMKFLDGLKNAVPDYDKIPSYLDGFLHLIHQQAEEDLHEYMLYRVLHTCSDVVNHEKPFFPSKSKVTRQDRATALFLGLGDKTFREVSEREGTLCADYYIGHYINGIRKKYRGLLVAKHKDNIYLNRCIERDHEQESFFKGIVDVALKIHQDCQKNDKKYGNFVNNHRLSDSTKRHAVKGYLLQRVIKQHSAVNYAMPVIGFKRICDAVGLGAEIILKEEKEKRALLPQIHLKEKPTYVRKHPELEP